LKKETKNVKIKPIKKQKVKNGFTNFRTERCNPNNPRDISRLLAKKNWIVND
jgi:hypothetical protein